MRLFIAACAVAAIALYAPESRACTNPEKGAGTPTVVGQPKDPNVPNPTAIPVGGTGGGSGGEVALDTGFVEVDWTAAKEVDGDPNNSGYWSHGGHSIATRVQITDVSTQKVVFDETVSQYDYATAKKGQQNPAKLATLTHLDPGRYEARVQTTFTRHDEVRFGMNGSWQPAGTPAPDIKATEPAAKFTIPNGSDVYGPVSGGCSTGPAALSCFSMLALVLAARRRR